MKNTKLINVRKIKKISQADIATYLKISQTQYQKRETGKIKISHDEWEKIAKLLNVEIDNIKEYNDNNYRNLTDELFLLKQKIKNLEQRIKLYSQQKPI